MTILDFHWRSDVNLDADEALRSAVDSVIVDHLAGFNTAIVDPAVAEFAHAVLGPPIECLTVEDLPKAGVAIIERKDPRDFRWPPR